MGPHTPLRENDSGAELDALHTGAEPPVRGPEALDTMPCIEGLAKAAHFRFLLLFSGQRRRYSPLAVWFMFLCGPMFG